MKLSSRDARGISIGIEFVVSVMIGLGAGWWLDKKFGTTPWVMMVGTALGFAAGIRSLLLWGRMREASERPDEDTSAPSKNEPRDPNDPV